MKALSRQERKQTYFFPGALHTRPDLGLPRGTEYPDIDAAMWNWWALFHKLECLQKLKSFLLLVAAPRLGTPDASLVHAATGVVSDDCTIAQLR